MSRSIVSAILGVGCVAFSVPACSDGGVTRDEGNYAGANGTGATSGRGGSESSEGGAHAGGEANAPVGHAVGEACSDAEPCRDGLSCNAKSECEPAGNLAAGKPCLIGAECQDGQCVDGTCTSMGTAAAGEECSSDADCGAGLRCTIVGLSLACEPEGNGDVGASCATSRDCFAGLGCFAEHCAVAPSGLPPLGQPWSGVDCEPPAKEGVKAYFEVPGATGAEEGDFFRLPFPNDVRLHDGKLDLSDFPTPGSALLGVDPVKLYVDAITENDSGWGAYPTVIFRFSGPFEAQSFATEAVEFVDITTPAAARHLGWQRFYTDARTNYLCHNFVAVQPPLGEPLEPGHTYAVVILSSVQHEEESVTLVNREDGQGKCTKDDPCGDNLVCDYSLGKCEQGGTICDTDKDCCVGSNCDEAKCVRTPGEGECRTPVVASDNLASVLGDKAPTDAKLKAAHAAFAPLRAFLAADEQPIKNVLTATVFTVGDVRQPMTALAAAAASTDAPKAEKWVKCGGAAVSPCPQSEGDRGCGDDVKGYDEYQAMLSVPVFQQGKPPYLEPADGGEIDVKKPHTEQVCLSLTVPEGAPPSAGWPTIVFAHGTGGSYRSHVRPEVAGVLAAAKPKFAVLGIDQVEHGPRRDESDESPDNLFFNFLNPAAARGNPLQGAADQITLARFAKALNINAATSTGAAIKLDPSHLYFFGHSQGSTEGSLMLPFADDYKAALLSGNGASLRDALRTKTKPRNVAAALPLVLQDPIMSDESLGEGVTQYHPVLSLLQQWIDPADPLNFAAVIGKPLTGHKAKHVFQTFGIDDSYSPPVTLATFAVAAGLTQVTADGSAPEPFAIPGRDMTVDAGYAAKAGGVTLGVRQYGAPKGSDGHFVVFDREAANRDMVLFFSSATGATPPVIGEQ